MAEKKKMVPPAKYPEVPTRITSIDGDYIKEFLAAGYKKGEISAQEIKDWNKLYLELVDIHGERLYFHEYRKQFIKAYFPALETRITEGGKKPSMGDFLTSLLAE